MDVTLHLGAHRTAMGAVQRHAAAHEEALSEAGTVFWGPAELRRGMLHRVLTRDARPRDMGRIALRMHDAREAGTAELILSDPDLMGTAEECVAAGTLYPAAGERLARLGAALGSVARVVLQIRAHEAWWTALMADRMMRGALPPDGVVLALILAQSRSWRDLVTEIACALPDARVIVTPFERFADAPHATLSALVARADLPIGRPCDVTGGHRPNMRALEAIWAEHGLPQEMMPLRAGVWAPFPESCVAALQERYADDLYWLRAGADGLAHYLEEPDPATAAETAAPREQSRGQDDECDQGRLEGAG